MFEDETDTAQAVPPSSRLEKQIHRLIAEDTAQQGRTERYYKKIKAENLDKYLSQKIQKQMDVDSQALGQAFFDGDE